MITEYVQSDGTRYSVLGKEINSSYYKSHGFSSVFLSSAYSGYNNNSFDGIGIGGIGKNNTSSVYYSTRSKKINNTIYWFSRRYVISSGSYTDTSDEQCNVKDCSYAYICLGIVN